MNQNVFRLITGLLLCALGLSQPRLYAETHRVEKIPTGTVVDLQLTIGSSSVAKGAEVCIPVRVNNFTSILGMEFTMTYDTNVLTYKSVKNFNLVGLSETSSFGLPGVGINPKGTLKVSWLDPNVSGVTVANGTAIFEVCFTAKNVDATTSVAFGASSEILNANEETVNLVGTPGTITVGAGGSSGGGGTGGGGTGGGTGGGGTGGGTVGTGTFSFVVSDTSVAVNRPFCLKVKSGSFKDILGIGLTMNYTAAALRFDSVAKFNLNGLNAATFGLPGVGINPLGAIKLSWTDPNVTGISVVDSTVLFELCFTAIQNDVTTNITFAANPEIINKDEAEVAFSGNPGVVVIGTGAGSGGGTGGGGSTGTGTFTLAVSDTTVAVNRPFCLKVKSGSFKDILGIGLTMNYTAAALRFDSVAKFNLDGLNAATFGLPGVGVNPLGSIKLSWTDPNVTGISVVDSTVLFELCFTAIQNDVTTSVTFAANPEIINKDEAEVAFSGNPGVVIIGTGAGSGGGTGGGVGTGTFTLAISDTTVAVNRPFCLKVKSGSFKDILGVETTMNYTAAALRFDSVTKFNLEGLNASSFGLPGVGVNPLGSIKLSWTDPNVTGISVVDSTTLFELCFTSVQNNVTTNVTFASNPEIINKDEATVPFSGNPGVVVIGTGAGGGSAGTGPFTLDITDATVGGGGEVCLPVVATNFSNILGMEFSITYDPAKLQFKSVTDMNLSGLTAEGNFGFPGVGTVPAGTLKVSWNDPEVVGKTVFDGTALFKVCFTAIGSNTTAVVGFSSTSEIIKGDASIVPMTASSGTVTISGVSNSNLSLVISSAPVQPGQEVCLDFRVGKFKDIIGLEFTIGYDSTKLRFNQVTGFGALRGLDGSAFGLPGVGTNKKGAIKVAWVDPEVSGVTLADSVSIFRVCFTATGTAGTTTNVTLNQPIEITNTNGQQVASNQIAGEVAIGGSSANNGRLQLILSDAAVSRNTNVCLDMAVQNFNSIVGMEFTLKYNPDSLTFKSIQNLNLSGLEQSSFNALALGSIKLSWYDPQVAGITLPGMVNIFQVCFTTKSLLGITQVQVDPLQTIEITDVNDQAVPRDFNNGIINVLANELPPLVIAAPAQITNVTCLGVNTGAINITVQGGSGNYTYRWSYQNATTQDLSNLPPGTYTVTVTDATTQISAMQTYTVTGPSSALQVSVVPQQIACFGANDGQLTATVSGGTPAYTYAWSGSLPAIANPTNVAPGSYTLTVTDASGCRVTSAAIAITQPDSALVLTVNAQNATCIGINNGQITASVSGGVKPYTYTWSNNLPALTSHSNLAVGPYRVTVTDARGCIVSGSGQVGQSAGVNITSVQSNPIDAGSDGAVNVTVAGGQLPYAFTWTGPGGFSRSTEDISNLNTIGSYCFRVDDSKGCFDTTCVLILKKLKFDSISVQEACYETANGGISIKMTGGQTPYQYLWSNGSNAQVLSGVKAGSYGITVTDATGTTLSGNFEIPEVDAIAVSGKIEPARGKEGVANGSIQLTVSGGAGAYTYKWNVGSTSASLTGLAKGEYCVTVTDGKNCSVSRCFQIDLVSLPLAMQAEVTNNRCFGQAKGVIRIQVTGGLEPYFALFNDGVRIDATSQGVVERGNLAAGTYTYVITDREGTTIANSSIVTQATAISLTKTVVKHDNDQPGCTGTISVSIAGGAGSYNVRWNSNNAGSLITNLCEGKYVPTVEDANGCSVVFDPIDVNTFTFLGKIVDNVCPGDAGGDVNLTVTGGAAPYTYFWLNSKGDTISRTKDLSNVLSGAYRVIVQESSGNSLLKEFSIGTRSSLSARALVTSNYRTYGVSCTNAADGVMEATAINGIGTNYIYAWLLNDNLVGSEQRLTKAQAGMYKLQVTDEAGCMAEAEVQLTAPPILGISGSVNHISCVGARDGDILVSASGGVPGSIYTYRWSTGATGPRISFLTKGSYIASVTDANNCTDTALFTVLEPLPMSVSVETTPATTAAPDCNGAARITVTGGTRPFAYITNVPGAKTTDSVFLKLCAGDYALEIVDSRGCKTNPQRLSFTILDRTLPCLDTRTIITPDGDGANETLEIRCIEELKDNRLFIFNEWGQKVYEAQSYSNNWKGTTQGGEELPEGAYFYVLEYTDIDGNRIQIKGSIALIRQ